jgi:uncharacterized membrane protein
MSDSTQTPRPVLTLQNAARLRFVVLPAAIIGLIIALAGIGPKIAAAAREGSLHAPNFEVLTAQSPVVQIHVYAAVAALLLGAVLMRLRKGVRLHRAMGWTWAAIMGVVAFGSLFITGLNGDHWSFIHLFSGWTLIALPIALVAARRHKAALHRRFMMGLFYGGLVINGFITFIPGRTMWNVFFG